MVRGECLNEVDSRRPPDEVPCIALYRTARAAPPPGRARRRMDANSSPPRIRRRSASARPSHEPARSIRAIELMLRAFNERCPPVPGDSSLPPAPNSGASGRVIDARGRGHYGVNTNVMSPSLHDPDTSESCPSLRTAISNWLSTSSERPQPLPFCRSQAERHSSNSTG